MIAKSGARVVFEPDADEAGRVMTASRRLVTYYLSRDRVLGLVQVDQLPAHVLAALLGQDVLMASAILSNAIGQYLVDAISSGNVKTLPQLEFENQLIESASMNLNQAA